MPWEYLSITSGLSKDVHTQVFQANQQSIIHKDLKPSMIHAVNKRVKAKVKK